MTPGDHEPQLVYSTKSGRAFRGDSRLLLQSEHLQPHSVDLIVTSPPFALTREKDYGNKTADKYVEWFLTFVPAFERILSDTGSLVIDVGGAYLPGSPKRSTYHFELAVALGERLELCQEWYWYNPAKLPSPAEWVNVRRCRVKDSVNLILWFARDSSKTKADNRRVLKRYSDSMLALLRNGYQFRKRPSAWNITDKFLRDRGGAIPPNLLGFAHSGDPDGESEAPELEGPPYEEAFENLLAISNTASRNRYLDQCRKHGVKPHCARFPIALPAFFIEFLTEPNDLVCDPFAGSNTTGAAAEMLSRRWVSCDLDSEGRYAGTYVRTSAFWFDDVAFEPGYEALPAPNWSSPARRASAHKPPKQA